MAKPARNEELRRLLERIAQWLLETGSDLTVPPPRRWMALRLSRLVEAVLRRGR